MGSFVARRLLAGQGECWRLDEWVYAVGLRRAEYGKHSLRRTKASMIYKATGNLRAIQTLPGHTKIENTVRYLGVDIEDALILAERTEIRPQERPVSSADGPLYAPSFRSHTRRVKAPKEPSFVQPAPECSQLGGKPSWDCVTEEAGKMVPAVRTIV